MTTYGSGQTRKNIMVIEDNCLTLNQIKDYLNENGYQVTACKYTIEATKLLHEEVPDLIIVDIMMPDIDGYEFCRWVRSQSRLRMVPVVFVTALTSLEDKLTGLRVGGDDYITKPFEMKELLARIQVIIQRMENFHELSMRDELTNAFNRRYFKERLEEEVYRSGRTGRPFTIVMLDIDFFKQINDSYGHSAGDFALIQFVQFLKRHLRRSDLAARLGGEEFVLLLPDTSSGKAYLLVERLRALLAGTTVHYNEKEVTADLNFTFSAGLASCPEHSENAQNLLDLADKALYMAKSSGRNAVKIATNGREEGVVS